MLSNVGEIEFSMISERLLIAASFLAIVAGCATVEATRVAKKADAHFTIAHFEVAQVDVPPRAVRLEPLEFRLSLPADGDGEYAIVQFIIDTDGVPREVQWVEASDAVFARAAVASVTESRYRPAKKAGNAVATKVEERFEVRYAGIPRRVYVGSGSQGAR